MEVFHIDWHIIYKLKDAEEAIQELNSIKIPKGWIDVKNEELIAAESIFGAMYEKDTRSELEMRTDEAMRLIQIDHFMETFQYFAQSGSLRPCIKLTDQQNYKVGIDYNAIKKSVKKGKKGCPCGYFYNKVINDFEELVSSYDFGNTGSCYTIKEIHKQFLKSEEEDGSIIVSLKRNGNLCAIFNFDKEDENGVRFYNFFCVVAG